MSHADGYTRRQSGGLLIRWRRGLYCRGDEKVNSRQLMLATLCVSVLCFVAAEPAYASSWTGRQLAGEAAGASLYGASCPTTTLCVAVGDDSVIASSTNPTGGSSNWRVAHAPEGSDFKPDPFHPPSGPIRTQIRSVS